MKGQEQEIGYSNPSVMGFLRKPCVLSVHMLRVRYGRDSLSRAGLHGERD
jgi:hypothetical protein